MPSRFDEAVPDRLIEQIARVLAKADGRDPDAPAWIRYPGGHTEGICWRDQYAHKARAVLEFLQPRLAEAGGLKHLLCEAREVIRKTGGGDAILNDIDDALDEQRNPDG